MTLPAGLDLAPADIAALGAFGGALLAAAAAGTALTWLKRRRRMSVSRRLAEINQRHGLARAGRAPSQREADEEVRLFQKAAREERRMAPLARLRVKAERRMVRAGGRRGALTVGLGFLIAAAGVAVVAARVFLVPAPAAAVLGTLCGLVAGLVVLRRLEAKFARQFLDNLPDAIDLVVRAVRAGIPVTEAIDSAGRDTRSPVREEFRRVADETAIGIDLEDALVRAARRVNQADFRFFVVALALQRETGGRLAETLENLSEIIRRRKEMRLKIRAMTAEGRMSAKVVAGIPFVAVGGLWLMSPEYIVPLVETGAGRMVLLAAMGCMGVGMAVINRMVKLEP